MEDDYAFAHQNHGIYANEDPHPEFSRYLDKAEKRKGLLPGCWNAEHKTACKAMGKDTSKANRADLSCAVEKQDIQEHHKEDTMPMKLRILAEKVYGLRVQGGL